jgi:hypothetical protein
MLYQRDSLRKVDSTRIFEKHRKIQIGKKILFGGLATISAVEAIKFGIDANGYPMLFFGIAAILFTIGVLRKSKIRSYDFYKKRQERRKKNPKFNKSWIYGFRLGLIGFAIGTLSILFPFFVLLSPISLISLLITVFFFIRGFWGKYDSKRQFYNRLVLGILGILMPVAPYLLIFLLFFAVGNGFR